MRADFEMEMYNPDGSRGESCGNGLRCAGKWLWDQVWTKEECLFVETMGSVKRMERMRERGMTRFAEDNDNIMPGESEWRVEIGEAILGNAVQVLQGERVCPVSVGNPHAVLFPAQGEPGEWPVTVLGPKIESAKEFPNRTNVEFVKVLSRKEIVMRVWERGVGETLACGTGACAAAAVCMQNDLTDDEITVKLLGGELLVTKDRLKKRFFLTVPAVTVYEGEL